MLKLNTGPSRFGGVLLRNATDGQRFKERCLGIVWRTARRGGEIREGKLQRNLHDDALCCVLVPVSMFQERRERHQYGVSLQRCASLPESGSHVQGYDGPDTDTRTRRFAKKAESPIRSNQIRKKVRRGIETSINVGLVE